MRQSERVNRRRIPGRRRPGGEPGDPCLPFAEGRKRGKSVAVVSGGVGRRLSAVVVLLLCAEVRVAASSFAVTAVLDRASVPPGVVVSARVPEGHYLYADAWEVRAGGRRLVPLAPLPAARLRDPVSGEPRDVLRGDFAVRYPLPGKVAASGVVVVEVAWQGCSATACFLPERRVFALGAEGGGAGREEGVEESAAQAAVWLDGMRRAAVAAGYRGAADFLAFLDGAAGGDAGAGSRRGRGGLRALAEDPVGFLRERGRLPTALLVLLGGMLLNLTPCVLSMIPVNLAIIGAAGARGGSRARGFLLGGAYGAGMALTYGLLGVAAVVTGGFFGALQSSPWFNLAVAVLLALLALALLGCFSIDFGRFQRGAGRLGGGVGAALAAGAVAALLAGACVAPVVMAVLLLAGTLYHAGVRFAPAWPFLLGLGMAAPWPLAGAGLAVLPRPGRWTRLVNHVFGAVVLMAAFYYGHLAWLGFRRPVPAAEAIEAGDLAAWRERLAKARAGGRPVLVDFQASWCRNCRRMERTTFRHPAVLGRLRDYEVVRVRVERPDREPARAMLRALGVGGLPAQVILVPAAGVGSRAGSSVS